MWFTKQHIIHLFRNTKVELQNKSNAQSEKEVLTCVLSVFGARGGIVVKALRYKPADRGFDFRWCHWNFSVT